MCLLFFFIIIPPPPRSTRPAPLFPYTTLFRSLANGITLGTAGGIVNTSADVTLSGVVDGVGSLVKQGAGILNLTGNNSLSGATVVQERSEEHTSELQSLMRISYAVFCLKKKNSTAQQIKKTNVRCRSTKY